MRLSKFKTLSDLKRLTERQAVALLERVLWPHGPACPHCGNCDQARVGKVKANPAKKVREGLYQCKECRKQFTVKVGTVMSHSKLKASVWVYVIASMANAKKGVSAKQLQRELKKLTPAGKYGNYESMWFACHRVRHAMRQEGILPKLGGEGKTVVADETFVGGKPRYAHTYKLKDKTPVVALVEHNGNARGFVVANVSGSTLKEHLRKNVDTASRLVTDEWSGYNVVGREFAQHRTVRHATKEFARVEADGTTTSSNLGESFFSLLKRSVYGTFHSVSPDHLQRYVDELTAKWNTRKMGDVDRAMLVIKGAAGKRLVYRKSSDITGATSPTWSDQGPNENPAPKDGSANTDKP